MERNQTSPDVGKWTRFANTRPEPGGPLSLEIAAQEMTIIWKVNGQLRDGMANIVAMKRNSDNQKTT